MKIWRYSIRGERGSWAVCFLDEQGSFAASSSYGGFGYFWSHHGKDDFRKFFLTHGGPDDGYMVGKLGCDLPLVCNVEKTQQNLRDYLERYHPDYDSEIEHLIDDIESADGLAAFVEDVRTWDVELDVCDIWEAGIYEECRGANVRHFVTYLMPELAKAIKAELGAENA